MSKTQAKKQADSIVTIKNANDIPLQNMAYRIGRSILMQQGWYACNVDDKKMFFELAK